MKAKKIYIITAAFLFSIYTREYVSSQSLAFSHDGKHIVSAFNVNTFALWDVDSGKILRTFEVHEDIVKEVVFSPDSKFIASGNTSGRIIIWETETGKELSTFKGHESGIYSIKKIAFSPNGKLIASGSDKIILWEISTGKKLKTLVSSKDVINCIKFISNGKYVIGGMYEYPESQVGIWNTQTGEEINLIEVKRSILQFDFSNDGKFMVSGGIRGGVTLFDAKTGDEIRTISESGILIRTKEFGEFWSKESINYVSFSSDSKYIAYGYNYVMDNQNTDDSLAQKIFICEVRTGVLRYTFEHDSPVSCVAFSSDGKFIAGLSHNSIMLWDLKTGEKIKSILYHY